MIHSLILTRKGTDCKKDTSVNNIHCYIVIKKTLSMLILDLILLVPLGYRLSYCNWIDSQPDFCGQCQHLQRSKQVWNKNTTNQKNNRPLLKSCPILDKHLWLVSHIELDGIRGQGVPDPHHLAKKVNRWLTDQSSTATSTTSVNHNKHILYIRFIDICW